MNVNQLPQEILTRIFRMSCFTLKDGSMSIRDQPFQIPRHLPSIPPEGPKLIPSARNLALVCSRWKGIVLDDLSLNAITIRATSLRAAADQLASIASNDSVQLRLRLNHYLSKQDNAEALACIMERYVSRIRVLEIWSNLQGTPELDAVFLMLSKFSAPRLNLLKYRHRRDAYLRTRIPALSIRAKYLTEVIFDGVRAEPTHAESWQEFGQLFASISNIRRLKLVNFHSETNSIFTEIAIAVHMADTVKTVSLPHLTDLILHGLPSRCVRLLCHLELKALASLAMPPYPQHYNIGDEDQVTEAIREDSMLHMKRLLISVFDDNIKRLLSLPMPSLKELEIKQRFRDDRPIALQSSWEPEHVQLDANDVTTNLALRFLSSSDRSSQSIRSLALAVNTIQTAELAFLDVKPAMLSNIRSLTLFGPCLEGEGLDDICVELPGVEVLRIAIHSKSDTVIKENRLGPQLYYDAGKSIRLLTNLRYLGIFLIPGASAIKTANCHGITRFLKERNRTSGFRRIERLVFNAPLTPALRGSFECLVDRVFDATDYDHDDCGHLWTMYGDLSELASRRTF